MNTQTISEGASILVTGASGFLGSHVADALSDAGYKVILFDRNPSPYLRPDQSFIEGDLMDYDAILKAMEGCEAVYHFAAIADIGEASNNPRQTAQINVLGTVNMLEAARISKIKRFVFASTVYVYSNDGGFYRASKQSCERFIETYRQEYGLSFSILRYGTLYGRRSNMNNRIYAMINNALKTKKIHHPGNGNSLREFIHVADAARLSVKILEQEYADRHLVLTGQEKHRIMDAAQMLAEMLPDNIDVKFEGGEPEGHYELTPYYFNPQVGHKLVPSDFVDFGQGLLDCIEEQYKTDNKPEEI